jgi:hypothetical protein
MQKGRAKMPMSKLGQADKLAQLLAEYREVNDQIVVTLERLATTLSHGAAGVSNEDARKSVLAAIKAMRSASKFTETMTRRCAEADKMVEELKKQPEKEEKGKLR